LKSTILHIILLQMAFHPLLERTMPHTITLSDATFIKLQSLAKPFVDTPESVVIALAEAELLRRMADDAGQSRDSAQPEVAVRLQADRNESLTHARLLEASVDGKELHRPKWNNLLDHLHILAKQRLGSFDALRRISGAQLRAGRYEENGYHYLPDADLSIQGVDANSAWDHSLKLARHLRVGIAAKFEWRNKTEAARPGQVGILEWLPTTLAVA
jgi:hypothetical protein